MYSGGNTNYNLFGTVRDLSRMESALLSSIGVESERFAARRNFIQRTGDLNAQLLSMVFYFAGVGEEKFREFKDQLDPEGMSKAGANYLSVLESAAMSKTDPQLFIDRLVALSSEKSPQKAHRTFPGAQISLARH